MQVVVRPKVPVTELLNLISIAYEGRELPPTIGAASYAQASPHEWLPFLLAVELERLFSLGFRRGYVDVTERLPYMRGRIVFSEMLARCYDASQAVCNYSDLTVDTVENRFLRGVVEMMLSTTLSWGVRRRLLDATDFMSGVTPVRPHANSVPNVDSNPMLEHYRPALPNYARSI